MKISLRNEDIAASGLRLPSLRQASSQGRIISKLILSRKLSGLILPLILNPILVLILILPLILTSCAPTINSFYNTHKNDPGVTAVEVPDFVLEILKTGDSDVNTLLSQVDDIKFMTMPQSNDVQQQQLANEMGRITASGYTDVYRRTELDNSISLFSVKERGKNITELLWFDQGTNRNLLLYLTGNFDPELISKLSDNEGVDELKEILREQ